MYQVKATKHDESFTSYAVADGDQMMCWTDDESKANSLCAMMNNMMKRQDYTPRPDEIDSQLRASQAKIVLGVPTQPTKIGRVTL
jgi:hypothetical protein